MKNNAHRIIFMDHGRIVESGPPSELLRSPKEPRLKEFLAKMLERAGGR